MESDPFIAINTQTTVPTTNKRWLVLASFSLLTLSNSWMWITWSPIETQVATYWNVTDTQVDGLSMVFMYLYIPLSFPALFLVQKIGMRRGLMFGAVLNTLGAWVRWQYLPSYTMVYVGTVLCSAAQTFSLAIPPLLSHAWFPPKERALATSIGVLSNQLGTAFGLGSTLLFDMATGHDVLSNYLGVQCGTTVVACVLIFCFVTNEAKPNTGLGTATHQDNQINPDNQINQINQDNQDNPNTTDTIELSYTDSLRSVLCVRNGLVLNFVYFIVVGCFYAVATFLSQLLPNWNTNDPRQIQIGALGIVLVFGGVIGSSLTGLLLDHKYYTFHQMTIRLLLGCFLSMVSFTFVVSSDEEASHVPVFVVTGLVGCFLTAVVSALMEYGTELAKPANEAVVGGIYNVFAQGGGCILVWIGGQIFDTKNGGGDVSSNILKLNYLLSGVLLISAVVYIFFMKPMR
jgi:FLVCR family feline leukemia virus subgroup C receptor-related protein